jgi:hypothetical protein
MSLMRLSVRKVAYADPSGAAYRKSGSVLGRDSRDEPVPRGRLKITQDAILGHFYLRNGKFAIRGSQPRTMSWDILSRPCGTALSLLLTQDLRPGLLSAVPFDKLRAGSTGLIWTGSSHSDSGGLGINTHGDPARPGLPGERRRCGTMIRSTQVPINHEDGEHPPRRARGRRPPER